MSETNKLLESALVYATRWEWAVHPLWPEEKTPIFKRWPDRATTDPATIREWWARWPGANIGWVPGRSGMAVIDLDVKGDANGLESWNDLKTKLGIEDDTIISLTPSGGMHLVFSTNGATVGNSSGKLGLGIDVKSERGYVVLPPSKLTEGPAYAWDVGAHPGDREPAALPPALVRLLTEGNQNGDRKPAPPVGNRIPQGQRDNTLTSLAGTMRRRGMVEAEILAALQVVNDARCDPPLPGKDLERIAKSVSRYEPAVSATRVDAELDRYLLTEDADDEGHAQCVRVMAGQTFTFCEAYGWLHWTESHWERENAEAELDRLIVDTLKRRRILAVQAEKEALVKASRPSAMRVRGVKYLFGSMALSSVSEFDQSPDHLNVENGVLDLRAGTLEAHNPRQRFTYCLPVEYDSNIDTSGWYAWLLGAVGGNVIVAQYLQEAAGYSLTGHASEEVLFYVYGPARAGKGTFTEAMLAMMGKPLATETDFETFVRDRRSDSNSADLANLKPCRFVAASESERERWLNAAKVKVLTGGNHITCALKYRDHFTYRPQFKVWLSSNHPVMIDVDDDAAWARIRVIHFPHSYLGQEDKSLKARMKAPAMLGQILAWAVEGARVWYAAGKTGLITPATIAERTQAARDDLDFVGQWLSECIEVTNSRDDFVSNPTLYTSYRDWCNESGITPKGQTKLTQALRAKGHLAGVQQKIGGRNTRGCMGVRLRP